MRYKMTVKRPILQWYAIFDGERVLKTFDTYDSAVIDHTKKELMRQAKKLKLSGKDLETDRIFVDPFAIALDLITLRKWHNGWLTQFTEKVLNENKIDWSLTSYKNVDKYCHDTEFWQRPIGRKYLDG